MITEDYVSFETAKLLKEKGFDGECDLFGRTDESELIIREASKIAYNQGIDNECIVLPTQAMAMKWLREVHNIFIEIYVSIDLNGNYHYSYSILNKECKYVRKGYTDFDWSYEQACDTAIRYCLENLI